MKRLFLLTFLLLIQILAYSQEHTNYIFEIPLQEGAFTFGEIKSITTDHRDMPWFGCDNGLYYYNSQEFKHYIYDENNPNSICSNVVSKVVLDSSNRIWVICDKGICYYNSIENNFTRLDFGVDGSFQATALVEYKKGEFLIVIDNKLYSFGGEDLNQLKIVNTGVVLDISTVYCDSEGIVYIGYADGSIYNSATDLKTFELFAKFENSAVTAICKNDDIIYVGYSTSGVDKIGEDGEIIKRYRSNSPSELKIPHNNVRCIVARTDGDIWIGTQAGIAVLSDDNLKIIKSSINNRLPRNSIFTIHVDSHNSLWIGTWASGIAYYNDKNYRFRHSINRNIDLYYQKYGIVQHFAPNNRYTTWVGNEGLGLSLYNHASGRYTKNMRPDLHVKSLHNDGKNRLWISTNNQGLYKMNLRTKAIEKIKIAKLFDAGAILPTITSDNKNNTIWLGSRGRGILSYNTESKESKVYDYRNTKGMPSNNIWALQVVRNNLLICSDGGFAIRDNKSGEFKTYDFGHDLAKSRWTYSMCYDAEKEYVYIGTKEVGILVFDMNSRQYIPFEHNDIFKNYCVYNILFDNKNDLWLSTNNGIYRYSSDNRELKHFTKSDGLSILQFHPGSCAVTKDNHLLFGCTNGFFFIDADNIQNNDIAPQTFLSNIEINNRPISTDNCIYSDSKHSADISKIELSHDNNTLRFGVTSNNMLKPKNSRFEYRLLGYLDEWVGIGAGKDILFTKLPFGKYTLEVRSCNNDGVWGDSTKIKIRINAPIYLTWYAILFYIIVIILIVLFVCREAAFKIKAKRDIEIEREINIINNKSFDEKVRFFMNISHELRTPLSLIKAPLGLLEREINTSEAQQYVGAIKRNTERLLRLTNQILDFRLLEVGKLKASPKKVDVVALCREMSNFFEYQIKEQQVNFTFQSSAEKINAVIDYDMTSKVVYNILGNALKYTDTDANITLNVECRQVANNDIQYDYKVGADVDGDAIVITIEDNGVGIPKDQLEHIFKRFYFNSNVAYSSSGIGLNMCMEYVNLHNGNICVKSIEGKGTKFTVVLPAKIEQLTAEEQSISVSAPYSVTIGSNTVSEQHETIDQYKSTILIVDDNAEIRFFLKKILGRTYNCVTAKNGQQGYNFAVDIKPSLIILDVLMPIMDGIECAQKLRENATTKLTPIIMLTGLTDNNRVVQGVKSGANAYLSKPIDEALLFAQIERLITLSTDIHSTTISTANSSRGAMGAEVSFTKTIEAIMEENLQNNMFDVNMLAQQMQVSRSTLQRNFKGEIGMGVAEYIRDYRLRSAIKLMESGVYNIDELSVCVGFNSSSYFCKAFKDKFGVSPKRYYDSLKSEGVQ